MSKRDDILQACRDRFGIPYGLPPGPGETDCSLWVRDVYEAVGLPFSPGVRVAEQERQDTVPISFDEVLPGDLLFFEKTYDAPGPAGPDGRIASHIGISLGAGTRRMYDANDGRGNSGETNIGTPYWQEHIFEARRHPALVAVVTGGGLSNEPEHRFTFAELRPTMAAAAAEFGADEQVMAGITKQEGGFRNWRVHHDGTGHGLIGLDDNGLLPDFERWSGMSVGRGANAAMIPPELQIRYLARTIAGYTRKFGDPYAGARAWHRGERLMNDARGQNYEALIRAHVAELYADPPPIIPPPPPPPNDELALLRARVKELEAEIAAKNTTLGYLTVDVAGAIQAAVNTLTAHKP